MILNITNHHIGNVKCIYKQLHDFETNIGMTDAALPLFDLKERINK